jgi:hypothetical protein
VWGLAATSGIGSMAQGLAGSDPLSGEIGFQARGSFGLRRFREPSGLKGPAYYAATGVGFGRLAPSRARAGVLRSECGERGLRRGLDIGQKLVGAANGVTLSQ